MTAFALFDTALGLRALVWRDEVIVGAALPERSDEDMRKALRKRFPGACEAFPSGMAEQAASAVQRSFAGAAEDFADIAVDLTGLTPFDRQVLAATRAIPRGETRTYGQIASAIGAPGGARAVGAALGRNPIPIIVPCHRVLAADGRSGGFSAPGGASTKIRILQIEGARRGDEPDLFGQLPWQLPPKA